MYILLQLQATLDNQSNGIKSIEGRKQAKVGRAEWTLIKRQMIEQCSTKLKEAKPLAKKL